MRTGFIPAACCILILAILILLLPLQGGGPAGTYNNPVITFIYASSGIMPQLLNTSQVDACIVWEPVVSTSDLGDIGTIVARDADFPPDHKWKNTACNVLVMRKELITDYPDIAALLSAVTIAGMNEIRKDPDEAMNITAAWVYGSKPIRSAGLFLNPLDVEKEAFQHVVFTDSAKLPDLLQLAGSEYRRVTGGEKLVAVTNESVKTRARQLLNGSAARIPEDPLSVQVGYLPSSDLYAPLYVTIMKHQTICETYGFCLTPDPGYSGRPTSCSLMVGGHKAAEINLLPGSVGGGIMTGLGQDAIDVAYIGSVPVLMQIAMGNDASVIQSVNAGGTGLVVSKNAPCSDWESFIYWIKMRSAEDRPVVIAVPQSSIQEEMIREAFMYEGITVSLYGLPHREIA